MPGTATSSPDQESSTDDGSTVSLPIAIGSVALLLLAAGVAGRDLWFFSDDWNILADYHDGNLLSGSMGTSHWFPQGSTASC